MSRRRLTGITRLTGGHDDFPEEAAAALADALTALWAHLPIGVQTREAVELQGTLELAELAEVPDHPVDSH